MDHLKFIMGICFTVGLLLILIAPAVAYFQVVGGQPRHDAKQFATEVFTPSFLGLVLLFAAFYIAFQELTPLEFLPINIVFTAVAVYVSLSTLMFVQLRLYRATAE